MSYRKEASIRLGYILGIVVISAVIALIAASLITLLFDKHASSYKDKLFGYSAFAVFIISCSAMVYKVDQHLNKRFNKNP